VSTWQPNLFGLELVHQLMFLHLMHPFVFAVMVKNFVVFLVVVAAVQNHQRWVLVCN